MKLFTNLFGLLVLLLTVTTALPTDLDRRGAPKGISVKAPNKAPVTKVSTAKAPAAKAHTAKGSSCSRKRGVCENLNIVVYDPWATGQRYHWALFLTKKDSVAPNTEGTIYQLKFDKASNCLVPQKIDKAKPNKWPRALLTDKTKMLGAVEKETADKIFEEKKGEFAAGGTRCQEWTKQMAEAMLGYTPDAWPDSVPA